MLKKASRGFGLMIILLFLVIAPLDTAGAVAPGGFLTCDGTDCSFCNLVDLVNIIIVWLFGIIFLIFAFLMAIAGWGLVTSGGNTSALEDAKSKFKNAIIGLIIVMAAWLLVDTIMRGLVGGGSVVDSSGNPVPEGEISGWGPWMKVKCQTQTLPVRVDTDATPSASGRFGFQAFSYDNVNSCKKGHSGSYVEKDICENEINSLRSSLPDFYVTKKCDGSPSDDAVPAWSTSGLCGMASDPSADGVFSYQSGISAQAGHASPALDSMLSCMANIVPGNVGVISSISDSLIVNGQRTWEQCRNNSGCAHTRRSRHYGGDGSCGNQSYAVDFGDEQNVKSLCDAANSCGAVESCSVHNGNHVHLSIPISC